MAFSKVSEMLLRTTGRSKSIVIFGVSGPPTNVVANNDDTGTINLTWTAPSSVPGSPAITSYTIFVSGGTTTEINTGNTNTSYTFTGGVKGTSYTFTVVANNAGGSSGQSNSVTSTVLGNDASGGTVTTVSDYNGTGQTWKVHEFTSNGTLTFSMANQPVRVYIGGGNGGGTSSACCGSCASRGSYGGQFVSDDFTVSAQAYSVVVGNGGAGGGWPYPCTGGNCSPTGGSPGGTSSFAGTSRSGGSGTNGGNFTTTNIRGSGDQNIGFQTWNTGCGDGQNGSNGIAGRVIVAYRVS